MSSTASEEHTDMSNITRKSKRIKTEMKMRSVSLPLYAADVIDISETGARVRLQGKTSEGLLEDRIRFGVSLKSQMTAQFEGFARVAWIRETAKGVEAGLQWEKLTADAWLKAKGTLMSALTA
jgi:PilZ domain